MRSEPQPSPAQASQGWGGGGRAEASGGLARGLSQLWQTFHSGLPRGGCEALLGGRRRLEAPQSAALPRGPLWVELKKEDTMKERDGH